MPTVIDALVVTLGLDKTKFDEGSKAAEKGVKKTKESAVKAGKDMEAAGKQAAVFFSKLRNEALMFVGVLAGAAGIKNFATNMISTGTSLSRMSTNLNMSVRDLRAWELAARNAGGSAAGIDAQLKESQNAVAMARRGFTPEGAQEYYLQGGADIRQFKTGTDYLKARLAIVERIEKTQGISAARLSASRMGLDDSQFNFYRLGASGVNNAVDQFRKLAGFTEQDAKNAVTLTQKFDILSDKFQLAGVRIGTAFIPYLDKAVAWLTKLADWINTHQDTIKRWIDAAIVEIKKFAHDANEAAKAVGGWKVVLGALVALKIASALSPLATLAAVLFSVGKALGLISAGQTAVGIIASAAGAAVASGAALAVYSRNLNPGENETLNTMRNAPKGKPMELAMSAVDKLQTMGLTSEQAQGVAGNLLRESSMNPDATNGNMYGLAQWDTKRQADFKRVFGYDIHGSSADAQLKFLIWELNNTEKSAGTALKKATNNQVAAKVFRDRYERPGDSGGVDDLAKRQGFSAAIHARMENRPNVADGPVLPVNAVNTLNTAASRHDSRPITSTTSSSEVNVNGPITITTQATDAKGVAAGLGDYIKTNILSIQANTGLQ